MKLEDVIDINEAGDLLNLKPERVGQLLRKGDLPGRQLSIGWIMHRPAIRRIAKRRRKWARPPI